MSHKALIGIPFAIAYFVVINFLGYALEGRFTRKNVLVSIAGAATFYALGAMS